MIADKSKNKVKDFFFRSFPLLDDYGSKLFLVLFCGAFSTFFILFYNPHNIQNIHYDFAIGKYLSIWTTGILGAIALTITQFFLRPKANLSTFNVGQFFLWVFFEFFFLCIFFFILFGERKNPFIEEFFLVLRYTISLAIIPYIIACLLIAVRKLSLKSRQGQILPIAPSEQHLFKDENGKIMFVIKPKQLLFLKSENNYISIFYLQNETVEKKLIRTNLKKLESELAHPNLIRIHRSYMVNLENITRIDRKKGNFHIKLDQLPDVVLKVSESYKETFETLVMRNKPIYPK